MKKLEYISLEHNLELFARQVVEGFITGKHKSPYHGFSVEFSEHRLYNAGESTKNIDWKLFGRTDKLFLKRLAMYNPEMPAPIIAIFFINFSRDI